MKHLVVIFFALFLASQTPIQAQNSVVYPLESNRLPQENNWSHYTARYNVDVNISDQKISGAMNVRMKRDSIFWFSFSLAIGFQVAKGVLINDTLHVLDLYNKNYYALAVSDAAKYLSIPLGVKHLQNLFIGQPLTDTCSPQPHQNSKYSAATSNGLLCFNTTIPPLLVSNYFAAEANILNPALPDFKQLALAEITNSDKPKEKASVRYKDWTPAKATFNAPNNNSGFSAIPHTIDISTVNAQESAQVQLSLITAGFEPIPSYPFRVGSEYTLKTLK